MQRIEVQPNEVIITQGETGNHFYVVEQGVFDVMVLTDNITDESYEIQQQQQHADPDRDLDHAQQRLNSAAASQQQQQQPSRFEFKLSRNTSASSAVSGRMGSGVMLDNDLMADMAANAADESVLNAIGEEDSVTAGSGVSLPAAAAAAGPGSMSSQQETGFLGGVQTEWGELVHTYVAPPMNGPTAEGPHASFGELALLYGKFITCLFWLCEKGTQIYDKRSVNTPLQEDELILNL